MNSRSDLADEGFDVESGIRGLEKNESGRAKLQSMKMVKNVVCLHVRILK